LLTGATGFLGAYLMLELARSTRAQIHCLVRAGSVEEGRARLIDNLKRPSTSSAGRSNRLRLSISRARPSSTTMTSWRAMSISSSTTGLRFI
ncbi:MAG: SDR family oxidoreductase, partial [Pseudomonadota bacterium]